MGILNDLDSAAYDLEHGRIDGLYPVARNFTIVPNVNTGVYSVCSYTTEVARVILHDYSPCTILVERDAFHHSTTTSRHLRRFLSALTWRIDWDALYKACDRECDKEAISGNGEQFINVREVA